jgi:chemotaxis protein methyltransferase CheR
MSRIIEDAALARLSELVAARFGLSFPPERWPDLERRTAAFGREYDHADSKRGIERLLSSHATPAELEAFANHLTVGETHFLREKCPFEALGEQISSRSYDHLRIWSAGCASGEEPYSIAIMLRETAPHLVRGRVSIFGTDLNTRSLRTASEGVYGEWSFRGTPPAFRSRYFSETPDGRWGIAPWLKGSVSFAFFNLMADGYPPWFATASAVDVIFCRNVLMYLTPAAAARATDLFHRCLTDGGWLIVSPLEASQVPSSRFEAISFPEAVLHRKHVRRPASSPPSAALSPAVPDTKILPPEIARDISYPMALSFYTQGHHDDAAEVLEALVSADPRHVTAVLLMARLHADQGKLHEACRWCERAIAIDKVNAGAYYLWASVLQEQGSLEQAAALLRNALYLDPNSALAHFALGSIALRQGKRGESAKHFKNTITALAGYAREDMLPESGGLTAGGLAELVQRSEAGSL